MEIDTFIEKWRASGASERANKDSFLHDLCDVLEVEHPHPKTGDADRDRYVFEREAVLVHGGERHSIGFIDLYKHGCFILEAKQGSEADAKKIGTARRGTASWNMAMHAAFGQALQYASTVEPPPPFLVVTDIGYCFDLYASFDGTRRYQKFPDALRSRINIESLRESENLQTLRAIFADPHSLDPSKRSARVTRDIAAHLATLAKSLEEAGHEAELVAKFLMRCLFTMFAEDVELLPKRIFADALKNRWIENPESFPGEVQDLWRQMNEGGYLFGAGKIWKFNGGLFADPIALSLTKPQLVILGLAAAMNWADVDPAIFGTLLERALNPKERHRLGAHYTPRTYVERLVRPTIEEPLRSEWDNVRAQVMNLLADVDPDKNIKAVAESRKIVYAFYDRLTTIRVLDPACGSGNFLFVALDLFKRLENEVIALLDSLGSDRTIVTFGRMVTPEQFLGIEIKPWAKEITELVLWIGYLQWQIRTRGWKTHPDEPILREYHNIECRDAVLDYDRVERLIGADGSIVTRWDGETTKVHPATGEEVPDSDARIPVLKYVGARAALWPQAEFIIGNPPYIGNKRMRTALSDEYVVALREAHPDVPVTADYVLYWWSACARAVEDRRASRFGLIATNSLGQGFNRPVIERHLSKGEIGLTFAIPDHPWVDAQGGAAVRISMTCGARGAKQGVLCEVEEETDVGTDTPEVTLRCRRGTIAADLSLGTEVMAMSRAPLRANSGLAFMGVTPAGDGFRIPAEALRKETDGDNLPPVVRKYITGRDLTGLPEDRHIIDFFGLDEVQARTNWPSLYQWVAERVKPAREHNKRASYREKWWLFAEPRGSLRTALSGLNSYIAIVRVSKFKIFQRVDADVLPDSGIIAIALDDPYFLGVLSSRIHLTWALRVSGTLEDRPYWNVSVAFDPFPFPEPDDALRTRIGDIAEQLDSHRRRQQSAHPTLTATAMYNVLAKLRAGETLTEKEKRIHEQGLISTLLRIHDDLDAAVFEAYGWSPQLSDDEILTRLVDLSAVRVAEEERGIVRWLRPEYQQRRDAGSPTQIGISPMQRDTASPDATTPRVWPSELPARITLIRDLFTGAPRNWTAVDVTKQFVGARRREVEQILDSLSALGLLVSFDTGRTRQWRAA